MERQFTSRPVNYWIGYDSDSTEWFRTDDNSVYFIRDVYSLSPLSKVGKIIIRISDEKLFTLGEETEQLECSLMLFDKFE